MAGNPWRPRRRSPASHAAACGAHAALRLAGVIATILATWHAWAGSAWSCATASLRPDARPPTSYQQLGPRSRSRLAMPSSTHVGAGRGVPLRSTAEAEEGSIVVQATEDGPSIEDEFREEYESLRNEAQSGEQEAQYDLGVALRDGDMGRPEPEWAAHWLNQAAQQGYPAAVLDVGMLFLGGVGVPQDPETGAAWVAEAANKGFAPGQFQMGLMLQVGVGVEQNHEWAMYWFETAAENGSAEARRHLGMMYEEGDGVEQSKLKAMFWYSRAAEAGDSEAMVAYQALQRGGGGFGSGRNTPGLPRNIRRYLAAPKGADPKEYQAA